jgi:hypothetical protein
VADERAKDQVASVYPFGAFGGVGVGAVIIVDTADGSTDFDGATRFSTDENNNLLIWTGGAADKLMYVFSAGVWQTVGVDVENSD